MTWFIGLGVAVLILAVVVVFVWTSDKMERWFVERDRRYFTKGI